MPSKEDIKKVYKDQHDELTKSYYNGTSGLSKEEFDFKHALIWRGMEDALIDSGHIIPSLPPRDLGKEIDDLKVRLINLEK